MSVITIHGQSFPYTIKKSKRARRMRITVKSNLEIVVTVPRWGSIRQGESMLIEQKAWLEKNISKLQKQPNTLALTHDNWQQYKPATLSLINQIIEKYKGTYPYAFKKISIKNTHTRWGSCSRKTNLNFNYRLLFIPREQAEYVVVHELCHLKEMNHSANFWQLVSKAFPQYHALRKKLHLN